MPGIVEAKPDCTAGGMAPTMRDRTVSRGTVVRAYDFANHDEAAAAARRQSLT